jgi:hypothetical protein
MWMAPVVDFDNHTVEVRPSLNKNGPNQLNRAPSTTSP